MTKADYAFFKDLARKQRIATIAAGVRVAHPAMYDGNVIQEAMKLNEILEEEADRA